MEHSHSSSSSKHGNTFKIKLKGERGDTGPSLPVPMCNTAYLDPDKGDDTTAVLESLNFPFQTYAAAITAILASTTPSVTNQWQVLLSSCPLVENITIQSFITVNGVNRETSVIQGKITTNLPDSTQSTLSNLTVRFDFIDGGALITNPVTTNGTLFLFNVILRATFSLGSGASTPRASVLHSLNGSFALDIARFNTSFNVNLAAPLVDLAIYRAEGNSSLSDIMRNSIHEISFANDLRAGDLFSAIRYATNNRASQATLQNNIFRYSGLSVNMAGLFIQYNAVKSNGNFFAIKDSITLALQTTSSSLKIVQDVTPGTMVTGFALQATSNSSSNSTINQTIHSTSVFLRATVPIIFNLFQVLVGDASSPTSSHQVSWVGVSHLPDSLLLDDTSINSYIISSINGGIADSNSAQVAGTVSDTQIHQYTSCATTINPTEESAGPKVKNSLVGITIASPYTIPRGTNTINVLSGGIFNLPGSALYNPLNSEKSTAYPSTTFHFILKNQQDDPLLIKPFLSETIFFSHLAGSELQRLPNLQLSTGPLAVPLPGILPTSVIPFVLSFTLQLVFSRSGNYWKGSNPSFLRQQLVTPGSYSVNYPIGYNSVHVTAWGAGGNGGATNGAVAGGGGGSGSAVIEAIFTIQRTNIIRVTIAANTAVGNPVQNTTFHLLNSTRQVIGAVTAPSGNPGGPGTVGFGAPLPTVTPASTTNGIRAAGTNGGIPGVPGPPWTATPNGGLDGFSSGGSLSGNGGGGGGAYNGLNNADGGTGGDNTVGQYHEGTGGGEGAGGGGQARGSTIFPGFGIGGFGGVILSYFNIP